MSLTLKDLRLYNGTSLVTRPVSLADLVEVLKEHGAEKEWRCVNDGDTRCVSAEDAFEMNREWPNTRPHDFCCDVLVMPLDGHTRSSE